MFFRSFFCFVKHRFKNTVGPLFWEVVGLVYLAVDIQASRARTHPHTAKMRSKSNHLYCCVWLGSLECSSVCERGLRLQISQNTIVRILHWHIRVKSTVSRNERIRVCARANPLVCCFSSLKQNSLKRWNMCGVNVDHDQAYLQMCTLDTYILTTATTSYSGGGIDFHKIKLKNGHNNEREPETEN